MIEIDGEIYLKQKEEDALHTLTLNEKGYKVIRFTNEEVFQFLSFKYLNYSKLLLNSTLKFHLVVGG